MPTEEEIAAKMLIQKQNEAIDDLKWEIKQLMVGRTVGQNPESCYSLLDNILKELNQSAEVRSALLTTSSEDMAKTMRWALGVGDKKQKLPAQVAREQPEQEKRPQFHKEIFELVQNNADIRAIALQVLAFDDTLKVIESNPSNFPKMMEGIAAIDQDLQAKRGGHPLPSWKKFNELCRAIYTKVFSFKHSFLKEMSTAKNQLGTYQFWSAEATAAAKASKQYSTELDKHLPKELKELKDEKNLPPKKPKPPGK